MTGPLLLALVIVAVVVALRDWRRGLYAMIAVAMLADPLRKMAPGVPAYMVLATVPVWICILFGAWRDGVLSFRDVAGSFPGLRRLTILYLLALMVPALLSLTYGPGSWQLTLLGLYTQACLLGGILLGFGFPRRNGDIDGLIKWYCVVASVMMIGAPLERWNIQCLPGLLGTSSLGTYWVTYRTGEGLQMMAGFFRSPDVMGWHAAALVMFGVTLALKSARWGRVGWAALAGWGIVALMFCARRKMIAMVPVFGIAMFAMYLMQGHARRLGRVLLSVGVMAGVGAYAYLAVGESKNLEKFYNSTTGEMSERVETHGISAVAETIRQAGFFGHGLGVAVQGVHNIKVARPRVWQESGPSMIAVELGVPGLVTFGLLLAGLSVAGFRALKCAAPTPEQAVYVGVASVVVANAAAGVVSSQIFGDPFIGCFLPFLIGVVLSGSRLQPVETGDRS